MTALMLVAGVVSSCGGSTRVTDVATDASGVEGGELWAVADVASSLEFFGDLAVVRSAPVTMSFDATARSVELATGITVDVPTGAFAAPTEVTAVIVDLEFDQYADNAPEGSAYVLSTKADVDLGVPLVLEVAEAPDTVTVMQPVDDQWQVVEVSAGSTTRIPITHFSEVPTLVVVPSEGIPVMTSPEPFGDSPASFLAACIPTVSNILRSTDHYGDDDYSLSDQLAYSFCARALVTKYSPSGVRVEVGCVGAKMEGDDGVGLFAAIDSCAKGQDAETEQLDSTTPPDSEDDEDLSQEEAPSVVDSGQPFLRVIDADVEFAGCPDLNFPDVCQYSFAVTLDYVTPIVPSTLKCDVGLLEQASERSLNDFSGTVTVAVEYSVLRGREGWDNPEVTARCSLFSAGGETFVPVTVDAVGERPDDSE